MFLLDPLIETKSVKFMHALNFGYFLPLLNGEVANRASIVNIGSVVRNQPVLVSLRILLIEQIQIRIPEDKIKRKV